MKDFPLLFTVRDMVAGDGFIAGVTTSGRALMVEEDDGAWWLYGVDPGAISETGDSPQEAYLAFRKALQETLFHYAEESASFHEFQAAVLRFFEQRDAEDERRWVQAREAVRAGVTLDAPFSELPKERAERPCIVEIVRLDKPDRRPTPADNRVEEVGLPPVNHPRAA